MVTCWDVEKLNSCTGPTSRSHKLKTFYTGMTDRNQNCWISAGFIYFFSLSTLQFELTVHDAPDGAEPCHVTHPHISEVPVLPWPEVHHPASVVGLLEHQPVAVHHVAGLAVGHAEAIHHVVTVVHQLMHLASEVLPLVDPHSVRSPVLWMKKRRDN